MELKNSLRATENRDEKGGYQRVGEEKGGVGKEKMFMEGYKVSVKLEEKNDLLYCMVSKVNNDTKLQKYISNILTTKIIKW